MIEMTIESVRINLATQQRVVVLKTLDQERYLFIWIAQAEAYAIAVQLQGTSSPRPLSHDLMKNLIEAMGARVIRVVISHVVEEIFYAQVVLEVAGQELQIDARPSDAFALAVRTKSPILVAEQVIEKCAVHREQMKANTTPTAESENAEQQQTAGDTHSDTESANVTALKERLAQVEEELRKAQARIAELEGK